MNANTPPSLLSVRGLSVKLGVNQILSQFDLPDLPSGRLVAVLGPNGSGKSTLLKGLAGLVVAHCQKLTLGGRDLRPVSASARSELIRYLPQTLPGDVHLTVSEAVLVALRAGRPLVQADASAQVQATLHSLGIAHLGQHYLDELSGGQKQLVGLAQSLSHKPMLLLLDEPLASLDLNYQHHVMQLLTRLTRERNLLIMIVLHDLNLALRYADNAVLMRKGALVASGEPGAVITPDTLAQTFSVHTRIEACSQGHPYVLVDDLIQI